MKNKIGIIGAGPAGLAAAITAGRVLADAPETSDCQIDLLEKNSEPGKKLLATGNGKCNITNEFAEDFQVCRSFFNDLGIPFTAEDRGRMYPYSKQAKSVRDTLVRAADLYNVSIIGDTAIEKIEKKDDVFLLKSSDGKEYKYNKLIIATGGKAGIQYGSSGDGLRFARSLDVEVKPVLPALVAMTYDDESRDRFKVLKGVRAEADLVLSVDGQQIAKESGEVQFTDYGISGICTFDLSRYLKDAPREDGKLKNCFVMIDLLPDLSEDELLKLLVSNPPAGLKGVVNAKIEKLIVDSGLDPAIDGNKIAHLLKNFEVGIRGTKGWKEAQVTAGGVLLDEVDMISMESKKVDGLFFAGEVLDYDGPCGGYNLSWAWKTGIAAGLGTVNGIEVDDQAI